jgi:precorrin-6B methylase 2
MLNLPFAWEICVRLPRWSKFIQRYRRLGVAGLLRYFMNELYEAYFEWRLGIDSGQHVDIATLGFDNPHWHEHGPSDYRSLRKILRLCRPDRSTDVFIDYGCGLGRVLCLAATMPWRKVIGVEVCPQLIEKARQNLAGMKATQRCGQVQLLNCNAAQYALDDDVTTIFLFNPFSGEVLQAVLDNIQESLRRRPRKVAVLFKNISKLQELGTIPWLQPVRRFACPGTHSFVCYEAVMQDELVFAGAAPVA